MLRGIPSITAIIVLCTVAGCSSGAPEATATASEAISPDCHRGGGPVTVALTSFCSSSLELTGVANDGSYVDVRLTTRTTLTAANVRLFPPDPIFPECRDDATAWNGLLGDGLTSNVRGELGQLADDGCDVSIVLAADGTVASIQPVP